MRTSSYILACVVVVALVTAGPAVAQCPPSATILETLESTDLSRTSRVSRFEAELPEALYRKAAREPGQAVATCDGTKCYGVLVAELSVENLWKAVSDDERHVEELPILHSEVIGGTPRGQSRVIFQYFRQWGMGRWWVSQVDMNGELFRSTNGALWEVYWEDKIDSTDPTVPPINQISTKLSPIRESYGAWLLVPINEECTVLEYFNYSDPGGALGTAQALLATRSVRSTLKGIARLAGRQESSGPPQTPFVRPDGTPLGSGGDAKP